MAPSGTTSSSAYIYMATVLFRCAVQAHFSLPLPDSSPPTLRMCLMCHTKVDTLGTHWPSPSNIKSCIFLLKHRRIMPKKIRAVLHRADFSTRLEPQLRDPIPSTGNTGLRASSGPVGSWYGGTARTLR